MSGGMLPIGDLSVAGGAGVERHAGVARGPRDVAGGAFLAMLVRIVTGATAGGRRPEDVPPSPGEMSGVWESAEGPASAGMVAVPGWAPAVGVGESAIGPANAGTPAVPGKADAAGAAEYAGEPVSAGTLSAPGRARTAGVGESAVVPASAGMRAVPGKADSASAAEYAGGPASAGMLTAPRMARTSGVGESAVVQAGAGMPAVPGAADTVGAAETAGGPVSMGTRAVSGRAGTVGVGAGDNAGGPSTGMLSFPGTPDMADAGGFLTASEAVLVTLDGRIGVPLPTHAVAGMTPGGDEPNVRAEEPPLTTMADRPEVATPDPRVAAFAHPVPAGANGDHVAAHPAGVAANGGYVANPARVGSTGAHAADPARAGSAGAHATDPRPGVNGAHVLAETTRLPGLTAPVIAAAMPTGEAPSPARTATPGVPAEASPRAVGPAVEDAGRGTPRAAVELPSPSGSSRAAAADPARTERSLDLLDPDFRVRLERVVARMEREYGHRVSIVETFRHQGRQDHLYEQGRSRPGEVVTWTRGSNHTLGVAADVIIDGSYGNPAAYARLRQVAAQEGLSGLGARDPGHLELPTSTSSPSILADGTDAFAPRTAPDGGLLVTARATESRPPARIVPASELAQPAPVAAVARVATVEAPRVAALAVPGRVSGLTSESRSPEADRTPPPAGQLPGPAVPLSDATATPVAAPLTPDAPRFAESTEPLVARTITSASAERIAHLLDLESSAPMKPLHQVLLRLDGAAGEDLIRLELQGNSVGATIDAGDPLMAERLGTHLGDLRRALERQGLETEALQVRARLRGDGQSLIGAAAGAEFDPIRISGQKASGEPATRERPHHETGDEPRQELANRNRSRREQKGGQNT